MNVVCRGLCLQGTDTHQVVGSGGDEEVEGGGGKVSSGLSESSN